MEKYELDKWNYNNIHEVEVSLLNQYGNSGKIVIEIGGNNIGTNIIESVLKILEDGDYEPVVHPNNQKYIDEINEDGYPEVYKLISINKNEEFLVDACDIGDFVVGVNIVSVRQQDPQI